MVLVLVLVFRFSLILGYSAAINEQPAPDQQAQA